MNLKFWKRDKLSQKGAEPLDLAKLDALLSAQSNSGAAVTRQSALGVTAVLACCRVIAEGIAQTPLHLMRASADGRVKKKALDKNLYRVLHRRPNSWMTSFEFREALTLHAALTGDGLAYKNRVRGEIRELIPLVPGSTTWEQQPDGSFIYEVSDGKQVLGTFTGKDILHLRGPSWDTVGGLEVVKTAREAIGLAISTEEYQARLHANGGRPSGVLSTSAKLSEDRIDKLRKHWQQTYGGTQNAFRTAVLDGAWEFKQMALSSVDAETMAARRFQIEEICRAFRVFPQMIMQSDKTSTYASAEQFFIAHVIHSLGPWFERWEQVLDRDLLPRYTDLFSHFDLKGLTRGSLKDRGDYFVKMAGIGVYSPNEIREAEGLNPYEGGDEYRVPMNTETPGNQGDQENEAQEP
nr:histone H1 [bacterium]